MTGILEQILAELQAIKATLDAQTFETATLQPSALNGGGQQAGVAAVQAAIPAQVTAFDPFGPAPASVAAAQPAAVEQPPLSEQALMALINPYLDNPTIKGGFSAVLTQLGIPRLPEARPDQYQDLYNRFTAVIAQHGGAQSSPTIM